MNGPLTVAALRKQLIGLGGHGDAMITGITHDTRQIQPGDLFVCMPSARFDTHSLIEEARQKGAAAVLRHDQNSSQSEIAELWAEDFRECLWQITRLILGDPGVSLKTFGVTGTNGKTTTAWITQRLLTQLGYNTGYLGTLGWFRHGQWQSGANTTPVLVDLYRLLAQAHQDGVEAVALEVSSHALAEQRVDGLSFDAVSFTNLTQDHLDFHGTMDAYREAKWRLFSEIIERGSKPTTACFCIDHEVGREFARRFGPDAFTFGQHEDAKLKVQLHSVSVERFDATFSCASQIIRVEVPLGGEFNVENTACAVAMLIGSELCELAQLEPALANLVAVPGRFQSIPNELGLSVIVDYAHTPDALRNVLEAARKITEGNLHVVFGCGGNRDATKRPIMGQIAQELADHVMVTSDNPRYEDPASIIEQVAPPGADRELDREQAIAKVLRSAKRGDAVVIAGKGHENTQIIGDAKLPFDDVEVARRILDALARH